MTRCMPTAIFHQWQEPDGLYLHPVDDASSAWISADQNGRQITPAMLDRAAIPEGRALGGGEALSEVLRGRGAAV